MAEQSFFVLFCFLRKQRVGKVRTRTYDLKLEVLKAWPPRTIGIYVNRINRTLTLRVELPWRCAILLVQHAYRIPISSGSHFLSLQSLCCLVYIVNQLLMLLRSALVDSVITMRCIDRACTKIHWPNNKRTN